MATKIAINGFGRIGRLVFRALADSPKYSKELEVVAVGDIVPADNLAYLLKYDSIQGKFKGKGQGFHQGAFLFPRETEDEVARHANPRLFCP